MWLILSNQILTWDRLQPMNWVGPRYYVLCKQLEESNDHLFWGCDFSKTLSMNMESIYHKQGMWDGNTLDSYFQLFYHSKDLKECKALPFLVNWEIWLSWNKLLFTNEFPHIVPLVGKVQALFEYDKKFNKKSRIHQMRHFNAHDSFPWASFDGES